jgi:hypothetical protein
VKVNDSVGVQATSNTANVTANTHYVAVTNVVRQYGKTVIGKGYSLNINVTAANQGSYTETFNVTVYANTTAIETKEVTLTSGSSTNITFSWNTTGFAYGSYTISANVTLAIGETNSWTGPFTYGTVKVTIPGDILGTGYVGSRDLGLLGATYGSYAGSSTYNPNADFTGSGYVGSRDLGILGANYGEYS